MIFAKGAFVCCKISKKSVTEVDRHVGIMLKIRRSYLGISQGQLGELSDLTFQQIQKYENGFNRIASGRLYHFARVLDVPITYFFEDLD